MEAVKRARPGSIQMRADTVFAPAKVLTKARLFPIFCAP
jgi:hypothetical protein